MFSRKLASLRNCTAALLVLVLCCVSLSVPAARAQWKRSIAPAKLSGRADKMSPDLFEIVGKRGGVPGTFRVVCRFKGEPGPAVSTIYQRPDVHVDYSMPNLNYAVATMRTLLLVVRPSRKDL